MLKEILTYLVALALPVNGGGDEKDFDRRGK